MSQQILYNDDVLVAQFAVRNSVIKDFTPQKLALLPIQIRHANLQTLVLPGFVSGLRT